MANIQITGRKISELPLKDEIDGNELVPILSNGENKTAKASSFAPKPGKGLTIDAEDGTIGIMIGQGLKLDDSGKLETDNIVDNTLSSTSENPVQNKVITEELNKIGDKVFPTTFSVSGGGTFEKRSTQNITVKWSLVRDGHAVIPDTVTINGISEENTSTSKTYTGVTANTTYRVEATKNGKAYTGSTSATFINPKYFGAVNTLDVTESIIKGLTKNVSNGKGYTGTISLNNQRTCYAYPKAFGALAAIKDANNFDYLASYVRKEITVWDEVYYVYVLKDPVTITNFKQIYS